MTKLDTSEFDKYKRNRGPQCGVGRADLVAEDRKKLEAALGDKTISARAVAQWLSDHGAIVSYQTVTRHRSGMCACGR